MTRVLSGAEPMNANRMPPATPLLQIEGLSITFGNGPQVVTDLNLTITAGERFALVGESGSGKSVTALSILRLLQDARTEGRIFFDGEELCRKSEREMRGLRGTEIAMIFQEPMTALNPLFSIGDQIVEAIELHEGIAPVAAQRRAVELLDRTGILDPAQRFHSFPHQLSGGQRQRAMIAMALACRPRLLLADEPTTALDATLRGQIMVLLAELQAEYGLTVLLITHDLNLVRHFAQRVGVMEKGRLVECASTVQLFEAPAHPYTERLIHSQPQREVLPLVPIAPVLLEADRVSIEFAKRRTLHMSDLLRPSTWWRSDKFRAVDDVSLQLRQGETVGLVGESGSGKTTLAMAMLGLQTTVSGDIQFHGQSVQAMRAAQRKAMRGRMQVVFQDPFGSLSPRMTIEEIVGEGLALHAPHLDTASRRKQVGDALREVGLDRSALDRYPHEFSGGQRQRIAIARVLVLKPQIVVLDEPTSALDVSIQKQVLQLLANLQRKYNLSYLLISHDLAVIRAMSHRVLVLKDGKLIEQGDTDAVFNAPRHPYVRALVQTAQS